MAGPAALSAGVILPGARALAVTAERLLADCRAAGLTIATAESCTGGLIAAVLTAIPGSSDVVEGGFVTYSNAQKCAALGVPMAVIDRAGAVSEPVAVAMAHGALAGSAATLAVAVTGVAGPGGGSADKPVGTVWLAALRRGGEAVAERRWFAGDRQAIRAQAVDAALALLRYCGPGSAASGSPPDAAPDAAPGAPGAASGPASP